MAISEAAWAVYWRIKGRSVMMDDDDDDCCIVLRGRVDEVVVASCSVCRNLYRCSGKSLATGLVVARKGSGSGFGINRANQSICTYNAEMEE